MQSTIGRRGMAACAVAAAALGVGTAAALPAIADSTDPTVSVLTLQGSDTYGIDTIVQAPSNVGGDWIVSSDLGNSFIEQYLGDGQQPTVLTAGATPFASSNYSVAGVNVGTTDYFADGTNLLALTGSDGTATASTVTTAASDEPHAATADSGGTVYASVGSGSNHAILECSAAESCTSITIPTVAGRGAMNMTVIDGTVWYVDGDGDLDSVSPSGTWNTYGNGGYSYGTGSIASIGNEIWLIGGTGDVLDELSASDPAAPPASHPVPAPSFGSATTPSLQSIVVGPDGNVWFADGANDGIGFIDVNSDGVSEYPIPDGDRLFMNEGNTNDADIALGPAGSDSLVFPLANSGDSAFNLLGQITSPDASTAPTTPVTTPVTTPTTPVTTPTTPTTTPTPPVTATATPITTTAVVAPTATLRLKGSATVSSGDVAAVKLSCSPAAGASCAGTLTLTVRVKVTTHRRGKTIVSTRTVTIGTAHYGLAQDAATTVKVKLNAAGTKLLAAASRHRLKVTATTRATAGSAPTITLTLTGAAPKKAKQKRR